MKAQIPVVYWNGRLDAHRAVGMPRVDPLRPQERQASRSAQQQWALLPLCRRLAVIRSLRKKIARHASGLARVAGQGRSSVAETLTAQVLPLADACRFLERNARLILAPRRLGIRGRPIWMTGLNSEVWRDPLGLVLIVGPSNYPLLLPAVAAIQALVAGNAVLVKPALEGSSAMEALASLLHRAGLPKGLLTILPESAEQVGAAIADGIDKLVFTGSAETGQHLLRQLAPRLIPATMELSGSDAVFVRSDANLDLVADALRFGLQLNGGATCIGPRRAFVHVSLLGELEARLAKAHPPERSWPLPQALRDRLFRPLGQALKDGAYLVSGEILPNGGLRGPIIVGGAKPDLDLLRADLFGPVLFLVAVADDEEALAASAPCPYALGASVFSENLQTAHRLARCLRVGSVSINDLIVPSADPRLPFGGRKRSGFGVTRGAEGLLEMTVPKVISRRRGAWRPHFQLRHEDAPLFEAYIQLAHGSGMDRARGLWNFCRALVTRGRNPARTDSTN